MVRRQVKFGVCSWCVRAYVRGRARGGHSAPASTLPTNDERWTRQTHTLPTYVLPVGAIEVNDPALSKKEAGDFPALGTEFPSLGAAPKDKKKKKQTMSLADFQSSGSGGRSSGGRSSGYGDLPMGPRRFDLNSLPTGPRVRGPGEEEDGPPMGGGFRGYGGDRDMERRPSRYGDGERGGFGAPRERDDEMMPSRADEVDNWGAERKFVPSGDRGGPWREAWWVWRWGWLQGGSWIWRRFQGGS